MAESAIEVKRIKSNRIEWNGIESKATRTAPATTSMRFVLFREY